MGVDILVPVLNRPHNVQPLLESLTLTRAPYAVFFLCSPGDHAQIEACLQSGYATWVVPWEPGKADFAKKINWGFSRTHSEWVFQGADDIRFRERWDIEAFAVAGRRDRQVIGTNDLHNPQVRRGIHSTHTLFTRRYIEEQGGSLDGVGMVFSEAYDHQFVDVEFCDLAKRRGVWAFAKQSRVEHLHPHWGLAEEDDVYRKAIRNMTSDYRLYRKRMGLEKKLTANQRRAERLRSQ